MGAQVLPAWADWSVAAEERPFSVGIEDKKDILADLEQALAVL